MLSVRIAANSTTDFPTQTYVAFVRRKADDLYLDFDDDTFKVYASLTDGDADYAEDADQPGIWTVTMPLPVTLTDTVEVITRDVLADALFSLEMSYVVAGVPLVDLARPLVSISTDTGGFNTLRVLDVFGDPIEGATIRVYTKFDFDAGNLDNSIGITATNADGRWLAPVFVSAGNTYTVLVQKDHVAGPFTIEIVV